jgi:hypothetical protein
MHDSPADMGGTRVPQASEYPPSLRRHTSAWASVQLRRRLGIPGSALADVAGAYLLGPLLLAQEARTLAHMGFNGGVRAEEPPAGGPKAGRPGRMG